MLAYMYAKTCVPRYYLVCNSSIFFFYIGQSLSNVAYFSVRIINVEFPTALMVIGLCT